MPNFLCTYGWEKKSYLSLSYTLLLNTKQMEFQFHEKKPTNFFSWNWNSINIQGFNCRAFSNSFFVVSYDNALFNLVILKFLFFGSAQILECNKKALKKLCEILVWQSHSIIGIYSPLQTPSNNPILPPTHLNKKCCINVSRIKNKENKNQLHPLLYYFVLKSYINFF